MISIAVIGAGMSGITLARQLQSRAAVTVFEKSPGFGGRMATRRDQAQQFDHGAQFFTARSTQFRQFLDNLRADKVVSEWEPKVVTLETGRSRFKREWFEPHYVAVPAMNILCKTLARPLDVRLNSEILKLEQATAGWLLSAGSGEVFGPFDWVVSAVPAPQAITLLPPGFAYRQQLSAVSFSPCFSLMLGFANSPALGFGAALVKNSPLSWIAVESAKPGRPAGSALVVHSDNNWARLHLELGSEQIIQKLRGSLQQLLGDALAQPNHVSLQRWRYARTETAADKDFLLDADSQLAVCGEWCLGNRVEDAYLSGLRLGLQLQELL